VRFRQQGVLRLKRSMADGAEARGWSHRASDADHHGGARMPQWLSPLEKPVNQEHVDSMQAFMGLGPRPFDLSLKAQTNALDLQIVMVNFGTVCESSGVCTSRQDGGRFFIPLPSGRRLGEGTSRVAWQRSPWVSPRKSEQRPRLGGRICRNFPW
jgi:hypothetical protein